MAAPNPEWIITDIETFKAALDGMRRKRRINWEAVFRKTGLRVIGALVAGRQANIRADSLIHTVVSLEYELVIREPSASKLQRRLAQVRKMAEQNEPVEQPEQAEPDPDARDDNGHLRRDLTDAERAEVDAFLDKYADL